MNCYLLQRRDGSPVIYLQYRDEWTEEDAAGRVRREPGPIPPDLLGALRPIARDEVPALLGRDIDWLRELPPEPAWRLAGREAASLIVALAVWAGLSAAIVICAWRLSSVWWFILLPVYLPAPVAAFIYTSLAHPRTRESRIRHALIVTGAGWVLSNPIPGNPIFEQISRVFLHFHPLPAAWGDGVGVYVGLILSFWVVGIPYCGYTAYCVGNLVDWLQRRDGGGA